MRSKYDFSVEGTAVTSTATYTTIKTPQGNDWQTGGLVKTTNWAISNTGTGGLSDFKLQIQDHGGGPFFDFITGTQWGVTNATLTYVGAISPAALGSATATNFQLTIGAANAIRVLAKGTSTTISVFALGADT